MPRLNDLTEVSSINPTGDTFPLVQGGEVKKAQFDKLPFIAAGTGAVARTVQEKLRDSTNVNIKDYGGKVDGITDDAPALNAAITALINAGNGGVVGIGPGTCRLGSAISGAAVTIPVMTNLGITIRGAGRRSTFLIGDHATITTLVRWGSSARDPSGTTTNNTSYGGIRDLSLLVNSNCNTATILSMIQPQYVELNNVNIENASGAAGIGLALYGSLTTGGYGAAASPHAWRCKFTNIWVNNCRTPLYMENADENDFYGCNFAVTQGLAVAADSLNAIRILQGNNNRFYGTLLLGDTTAVIRDGYVGVKIENPTQGILQNFQMYGLVAEGFDRGVWIAGGNAIGTQIIGYTSSINATPYLDDGSSSGNGTRIFSPNGNINYYSRRKTTGKLIGATYSASITVDATVGNWLQIVVTDGNAFTINAPLNPVEEQRLCFEFVNISGGALGVLTWNSVFKLNGALTNPATTFRRAIEFQFDGAVWRELWRSSGDQPN